MTFIIYNTDHRNNISKYHYGVYLNLHRTDHELIIAMIIATNACATIARIGATIATASIGQRIGERKRIGWKIANVINAIAARMAEIASVWTNQNNHYRLDGRNHGVSGAHQARSRLGVVGGACAHV